MLSSARTIKSNMLLFPLKKSFENSLVRLKTTTTTTAINTRSYFHSCNNITTKKISSSPSFTTTSKAAASKNFYNKANNSVNILLAALFSTGGVVMISFSNASGNLVSCDNPLAASGDIVMLEPTKEPSTGILFPRLCNGLTLVGCGVRVKWRFVKVYAVGTYVDPIAMHGIKKEKASFIEKALLDPMYPRTIRIVMNRSLSIDKFTSAIMESLEPRMNNQDLEKLEEFKNLNPKVDLLEGSEMEMTIRGDTMLYKNALGVVGVIRSKVFCDALCDVYFGDDPVSPGHKDEVIKGIQSLP